MDFTRALVTGASSGIGRAMAKQLAERGADLIVVARSEDLLEELASEVRDQHGVTVEVLPADLTVAEELADVETRVRDLDRPVDLVVNNAAFGAFGRFDRIEVDRQTAMLELNVVALTRLSHAAASVMTARGGGAILNVSSLAAFQPVPTNATYAATKAYVNSFGEALHEELRGTGVHVTTLCPGFTRTNFAEVADVERSASRIPDVLWQSADEVAAAGLAGVARNKAIVVPGIGNRVGATVSTWLPNRVLRRTIGTVAEQL